MRRFLISVLILFFNIRLGFIGILIQIAAGGIIFEYFSERNKNDYFERAKNTFKITLFAIAFRRIFGENFISSIVFIITFSTFLYYLTRYVSISIDKLNLNGRFDYLMLFKFFLIGCFLKVINFMISSVIVSVGKYFFYYGIFVLIIIKLLKDTSLIMRTENETLS